MYLRNLAMCYAYSKVGFDNVLKYFSWENIGSLEQFQYFVCY